MHHPHNLVPIMMICPHSSARLFGFATFSSSRTTAMLVGFGPGRAFAVCAPRIS